MNTLLIFEKSNFSPNQNASLMNESIGELSRSVRRKCREENRKQYSWPSEPKAMFTLSLYVTLLLLLTTLLFFLFFYQFPQMSLLYHLDFKILTV